MRADGNADPVARTLEKRLELVERVAEAGRVRPEKLALDGVIGRDFAARADIAGMALCRRSLGCFEVTPDENAGPLLPAERTWGPVRLGVALATAAAATWCYLIGESVGQYLGFIAGGLALTAGCHAGHAADSACPRRVRFVHDSGVDSIASTKPQFGSRGWVIPAALQAISIIGWNSLLIIFFAKSATQWLIAVRLLPSGVAAASLVPALTVLACAVIFLSLRTGAHGVSTASNILVVHVLVGLWMLYLLMSRRWDDLAVVHPALASPDRLWNYTTGPSNLASSRLSPGGPTSAPHETHGPERTIHRLAGHAWNGRPVSRFSA